MYKKNSEQQLIFTRKTQLNERQKIVDLMRENPSITIAELVSELGMSRSGVSKQIAKLT